MGTQQTKERDAAAAALMVKKVDKNPTKMTIERKAEDRDSHAVLTIPKTEYKILYVDPASRGDVIAPHGYVALVNQRRASQRRATNIELHKSMFSSANAKRTHDEIHGGDSSSDEDGPPVPVAPLKYSFPLDDGDDANMKSGSGSKSASPKHIDKSMVVGGQRVEKFAPEEDPLEMQSFKGEQNFPDKTDDDGAAAGDDDPFADGDGLGAANALSGSGSDKKDGSGKNNLSFLPNVEVDGEVSTSKVESNNNSGSAKNNTDFAAGWENASGLQINDLGAPIEDDAMKMDLDEADMVESEAASENGDAAPGSTKKARFVDFGDDDDEDGNSGSQRKNMSQIYGVDKQQFFFPKGSMVKDRVFFVDDDGALGKSTSGGMEPSLGSHMYELEEDEIHEMAGVHRMTPRCHDTEDDPLATYHPKSNILEALYMVIEAPMEEIRLENVVGSDQTEDELKKFRDAAMKEAKELFLESHMNLLEETQTTPRIPVSENTYSSRLLRTNASGQALLGTHQSMRATGTYNGMLGATNGGGGGNSHYNIQTHDEEGNEHDSDEVQRQRVAQRKKLHKMLNKWKANFKTDKEREPEAHELASDPGIRDVYAAYKRLKKETKEHEKEKEKEEEEAAKAEQNPPANDAPPEDPIAELTPRRATLHPLAQPLTVEEIEAAKERKKELKDLQKHVKQWKKEFKANEGRAPTKRDIRSDEVVGPMYERVKELERLIEEDEEAARLAGAATDAADAGSGSERDENEVKLTTDQPEHRSGAATPSGVEVNEEFLDHAAQLDNEEGLDRRETEADENIEWRGIMKREEGERPAGCLHGVHNRKKAVEDVVGGDIGDEEQQHEGLDNTATTVALGDTENGGGLSRKQSTTEIELTDDTQKAVDKFKAFSRPAKVQSGWGDTMGTTVGDSDSRVGSPNKKSVGFSDTIMESEDPKALAKRRKALGKELNAWKAQFASINGREPTIKDIKNDPEIAPTYHEYTSIPKDIGKGGPVRPDTSDGLNTTNDGEEGLDNTTELDEKALAKRRKALAKELNAWKAQFAENNGREPTTKDILGDESIRPVYTEYTQLKKGGASAMASPNDNSEGNAAAALAVASAAGAFMAGAQANKKKRKKLGKQLNDWKNQFAEENGRAPTTKDIKSDPSIYLVFQEYNSISKDGEIAGEAPGSPLSGGNDEGRDERPSQPASPVGPDAEAKLQKKRKKAMGKQLNEWKAKFEEENGRKPKVDDIKADPSISEVYAEYTEIQAKEKAAAGGEMLDQTTANLGVTTAGLLQEGSQDVPQGTLGGTNRDVSPAKSLKKRKKELTKQLNDWKIQFIETHDGREATDEDIAADETIFPVWEELQTLQVDDGADNDMLSVTPQRGRSRSGERDASSKKKKKKGDASPAPPDALNPEEQQEQAPMDPKALAKRRKELAKQLNKWKTDFAARTGEHPTKKDIENDPLIKAVFDEYSAIPKDGDMGGTMGGGGSGGLSAENVEEPKEKKSKKDKKGKKSRSRSLSRSRSPGGSDVGDEDPQERSAVEQMDDEEHEAMEEQRKMLKAKKKELAKELNAWKSSFQEANGRGPKKADIQEDEDISALYEELEMTKEQLEAVDAQLGR